MRFFCFFVYNSKLMTKKNASIACLFRSLGLTTNDLSDIAGHGDSRTVRRILSGTQECPDDLREALILMRGDLETVTQALVETVKNGGELVVYKSTHALREHTDFWPERGYAAGGYPGLHQIAAFNAQSLLAAQGTDVDIFYGEE